MIERRRMARPHGPSITEPSESGPRWTSVSFIAASAAGSGAVAPSRLTRPHIPHMRASLESAPAPPQALSFSVRLAVPAAQRQADDADHGCAQNPQIQPDRAVRDVLEVVNQLVLPGVLPRDPRLGEAGYSRADDEPLPILRHLLAEPVEERGPDGPRADHAHLSPHHVEQLRHLVDVSEARRAADHRHLVLSPTRELLAVDVAEPSLRSRRQRAELVHSEDTSGAADALAPVEHRPPRGE